MWFNCVRFHPHNKYVGQIMTCRRAATIGPYSLHLPLLNRRTPQVLLRISPSVYKVDEQMRPTINESLSQLLNESNFDKTLQGNHSSTERGNETHVRRYRRGLGWRNGGLDWWYGNWCGGNQGGYTNNPRPWCKSYCWQSSSYITSACRSCLPPKDGFDSACMEHDRYMIGSPAQPIYVWCEGTTLPTPTLPNPYPVPSSCPLAQ